MHVDSLDRRILELLQTDGRLSYAAIGREVMLSTTAVQRRVERLQDAGVIRGVHADVNLDTGSHLAAIIELRFDGTSGIQEVEAALHAIPEANAVHTLAGDPDVLVFVHVDDVAHLRRVVESIRRIPAVRGTRTHMVLNSWNAQPTRARASDRPSRTDQPPS